MLRYQHARGVRLLHERGVLRQHHHVLIHVLLQAANERIADGHAVADAAVQQHLAVHERPVTCERHGGRRHEIAQVRIQLDRAVAGMARAIRGLVIVIVRLSQFQIAGNGGQLHRGAVDVVHIERIKLMGNLVEREVDAECISGEQDIACGEIAGIIAVLQVDVGRAPDSAAHVVVTDQCAGRNADCPLRQNALFQQVVQNACSEQAPHCAAFQYQVEGQRRTPDIGGGAPRIPGGIVYFHGVHPNFLFQ